MRTIRTKIYKFNELSKAAKQTAIEWWKNGETFDYLYEEAWESLKKFCEVFNIDMDSYDFNEPYRSRYSYDLDDKVMELTGQRLATYIWNNYKTSLYKGKYYSLWSKTEVSYKHHKEGHPVLKKRYSKCQIVCECPFTGTCYDMDLLDPIVKFMQKPSNRIDFKHLLEDCLSSLCKSLEGEIKARMEDDAVIEAIEANEYEFTKEGNRF